MKSDVTHKDKVNNIATIPDLKENISREIIEIELHLCEIVMENFIKRMVSCRRSRGGHLVYIIFHLNAETVLRID